MSTGLEAWNTNLAEIGPMYPFVGTETILVVVGLASWIVWQVMQIKMENRTLAEEDARYQDKVTLSRARRLSTTQTLAETIKAQTEDI